MAYQSLSVIQCQIHPSRRIVVVLFNLHMGVHTFSKGICPKVNVMARLEFELAYYDSVIYRFNHYPTRTLPCILGLSLFISFWWHINLCQLFDAKSILLEEQLWHYLTYIWEDKGVHTGV